MLANAGKKYLRSRLKNDEQKAILDTAWLFVSREVAAANQVVKPRLIEAAKDGKISPEELAALKQEVINKVRQSLGRNGVDLLNESTGSRNVDSFLGSLVEAAVREQKTKDK